MSDTEIRVGSTMPFSGPVSGLGILGKAAQAYFEELNDKGGINGRKVKLIQYDDGYNPGKALELTRRLVEQDKVALIYQTLGTPSNNAIHRYLNQQRIPQLLIFSGANKWVDVSAAPYVVPASPSYAAEGRVYARWLLENQPKARVAVLMQNDDFGKDYLDAIKNALGARAKDMIVAQSTYEVTDPTVDSQVVSLKASGADVFFVLCNGKFAVQALRKAHDIGWKPQVFLPLGSSSIQAILRPAGADKVIGAISIGVAKSPSDPRWNTDSSIVELRDFVKRRLPSHDPNDQLIASGHSSSQILTEILRRCGDDLTRENIMKNARDLKGFRTTTMLPGIALNTTPTNHELYDKLWLQRFNGESWVPFGNPQPV
ncbi:ABC transporter substrate-binding protein [Piscinibacter sp. HJYY11]|uniref:ABC transporter substrate-binding protein n=1 Tax=Piscinibacter sp. HJYY11 TaxID=2801333 RepID=UPI00191D7B87|nr:ABC transporter substrate-binding protein [Piscinibacter sp. HJYY11]MBL0727373.1 ABC transporter substrate-binding protein [Piscinibacter sp. HJYY11]